MFEKKMETEAIPERVLSLCQMLTTGITQESELKKSIEPVALNEGNTSYFRNVCDAAIQLGLISRNDDTKELNLIVNKDVVETHENLRKFIVSNIDRLAIGQFYRTTQFYIVNSDELFVIEKELQNVSKLAGTLNDMYKERSKNNESLGLKNENMLAWRFWSTYLGFGYLHDMFFLPNTAMYLKTCIECSDIKSNEIYTISEFVNEIRPYIDICISSQEVDERRMNMALSNGFRTLHDLGILELKYANDRQDEWNLATMDLHQFSSLVTDCIYKGR